MLGKNGLAKFGLKLVAGEVPLIMSILACALKNYCVAKLTWPWATIGVNRLELVLMTVVGTAYFDDLVYSKLLDEWVVAPADC